jgi:hypothetical protein
MSRYVIAAILGLAGGTALAADDPKTFEGTWVNRKYNTNGTLKCVATKESGDTWKATFSGKFQGENFSYDVTFKGKPGRGGQTDLSGTAEIRNHKYTWEGTLKGEMLTGRYRSNSGYFGEFNLRTPKK